jgi:hypothetical protein
MSISRISGGAASPFKIADAKGADSVDPPMPTANSSDANRRDGVEGSRGLGGRLHVLRPVRRASFRAHHHDGEHHEHAHRHPGMTWAKIDSASQRRISEYRSWGR